MPAKFSKFGVFILALSGLVACVHEREDDRLESGWRAGAEPPPISGSTPPSTAPRTLFQDEAGGEPVPKPEKFVELGTGRLVGSPSPLPSDALRLDEAEGLSLNVIDADIREVARLILEDGLGVNYAIDPAVTGSVTIRTSRPVPPEDILRLLSSALQANGAALIEKEGFVQIVPLEGAATAGGKPATRSGLRAGRRGAGILVAPLRYTDATRLGELLQPFVANRGVIQIDGTRNTLVISGPPDQIETMGDLIDMFDVDWMAGMSFGFYPLERVQAEDLAIELDQIFGRGEDAPENPALRFVPIERLRALLVIATEPASLQRAESWIERLDRVGEGDEDQIYVYPVQNGRAADLASVLGELFDIRTTAVGPESLLAPGLEPIELGTSDFLDPEPLREPDAAGRDTRSERLSPERRRPDRSAPSAPRDLTEGREDVGTRIVADEANNALLIRALPKDYRKIETALEELDRPPLQVLLEATIAEVTLRDELSYGIQWFFNAGRTDLVFSERESGSVNPFFPGFAGILSAGDARVVISALDSVSDVNVISSPQILVLDNQSARLEVGDEVPIVTRQSEGDDIDTRTVNTVEQRQTGVILDVTPRVNASGLVVLDIRQEVSDVVETTTSGIDSPTIAQRRVGTTVAVSSDETVALGGLIQDGTERLQDGIPILSSIPVLGVLFGGTTDRTERTELLILITPKILPDTRAAVAATDELRKRLQSVLPLEARISAPAPALPAEPARSDREFLVQLALLPSRAAAADAWTELKARHAELIGDLPHRIEPRLQNGEESFRLQLGPLPSLTAAYDLCARLLEKGADCQVVEQPRGDT